MDGNLTLIMTLAGGLTAALPCGYITHRLGLSPIVGYLLAGVIIGPYTPGFIGDAHIAHQLAELGVILLMFGVGLHFHLKDLLAVKGVAIPGAVGQSFFATIAAVLIFHWFGISWLSSTVIGMAMAVASTVVLIRVLMDADVMNTSQGHIAVGWLIVEDIFTVVLLVLIPVMGATAGGTEVAGVEGAAVTTSAGAGSTFLLTLGVALLKLAVMVFIVLFAGAKIIPPVMVHVARLRSRELFTLTVLVISIAIAAGSYYVFGASMALGAFLAGMVVAQSPVSHQAAADALPMRDAFAVLFFVSVGMLFDPQYLITHPMMVVAGLFIIFIVKPLTALIIVSALGHPIRTSLTVALALSQIGEFSFILSDLARKHGIMPDTGHNLLVACAIISITLNPLIFRTLPHLEAFFRKRPFLWKLLNGRAERIAAVSNLEASKRIVESAKSNDRLAIVVGYGPVGRSVDRILREAGISTVIIDMNMNTISSLNSSGQFAIFGDAAHSNILQEAGMKRASHLVLTLPHTSDRAAIVAAARDMKPDVRILVRARYIREREDLEHAGANAAVFEEVEAAVALARLVLADTGLHREEADKKINSLRLQLIMDNISNIRSQRVRSVMVPWSRVRALNDSMDRSAVQELVSQERFSRWPVVSSQNRAPIGYLLTKDLIAQSSSTNWQSLLRPLKSIRSDDTIESVLLNMQDEGASVYVVEDMNRPVGLVTFEDILEQVVGQIEDEYPHEALISFIDPLNNGAIIQDLVATNPTEAIRELAASIPQRSLPMSVSTDVIAELALDRESQYSTNLGNGIAIPHAKVQSVRAPIIVYGRSFSGVLFSPDDPDPVQLIFLLVTPSEQPDLQLALLGQLAGLFREESVRERLKGATTTAETLRIFKSLASKVSR